MDADYSPTQRIRFFLTMAFVMAGLFTTIVHSEIHLSRSILLDGSTTDIPTKNRNSNFNLGNSLRWASINTKGIASAPRTTVHMLYGLSGNRQGFLDEFETSLKSVLMNAPIDYDLMVHIMADEQAYQSMPRVLGKTGIDTWQTRNQVTIQVYDVEPKIPEWGKIIEKTTNFTMEKSYGEHTIGCYFRLFAHDVLDRSSVEHVVYLDTDVVILAHLDGIWSHADPNAAFQWGERQSSGFVILNLAKLDQVWEAAGQTNIKQLSHDIREQPGDQLLFKAVNRSNPEMVSLFPKEWDVPLANRLWKGDLRKHRPNGVGNLHFSGSASSERSVFASHKLVKSDVAESTWGLAKYYLNIEWSYAKFIVSTMIAGDGHPLVIEYHQ